MIDWIVGVGAVTIVALSVRTFFKSNKKGGGCSCGCEGCGQKSDCSNNKQ